MIPAEPSQFHRRLLTLYFRRRAKRLLSEIRVKGIEKMEPWGSKGSADHPLIIVANHSSWWDAVLPILISLDYHDHDAYGIMEERQLARYRFFKRVGLFSVNREDPRSAMRSLDYASELLNRKRRVLWMFPQGELTSNDRRPISIYSGTSRLLGKLEESTLLPIAFRYELLRTERPQAFGLIGEPLSLRGSWINDIKVFDRKITQSLTDVVDRVRDDTLCENYDQYQVILRGRGSIDERWDHVRGINKNGI